MNKRTAFVYGGAAFLIVVFGFRTLARTIEGWEFLENFLTPVTIFALLLEFSLLVMYAHGIYIQPDSPTGAPSVGGGNAAADITPALDKLESINTTLNDFTDQMAEIKDHLANHNEQIENLNTKLEDLVDDQLDEKVKTILSSMIRK